jgi:cullin-associated NEDD8-dissociated protein 1
MVVLSLLIMGELGRFMYGLNFFTVFDMLMFSSDMTPQHEIFTQAIELFSSESEEVRAAAAFAAGMSAMLIVSSERRKHFLQVT